MFLLHHVMPLQMKEQCMKCPSAVNPVIVVLWTHCSIIIIVLGRQHQLVVAQGTRSVPHAKPIV